MAQSSLAASAAAAASSTSSQVAVRVLDSIPSTAITIGDEIGKGRFKKVHRGRHKRQEVVILRYTEEGAAATVDGGRNELLILQMLASMTGGVSPCVPDIYGLCHERDATLLVQEFAVWGAVKAALKSPELAPRITPAHMVHCTIQMAQGMAFLEAARIVHADLSCRNVLLFALEDDAANTIAKITDFGLSVILQEGTDHEQRKQPQATRWCSPETISSMKLSNRTDVWAYGTTVWELYNAAEAPWVRRSKRSDVATRLRDLAETGGKGEGGTDVSRDFPKANGCAAEVHSVVLDCLKVDEYARPSFADISSRLRRIFGFEEEEDAQASADPMSPVSQGRFSIDRGSARGSISPDGSPCRPTLEQEPSFPPEVVDRPWLQADGAPEDDADFAHFKAVRMFLRSQLAAEALPDQAVLAMWQEVDEAQAREAYLMDLVRRMQAVANESTEVVEMLEESLPKSPMRRAAAAAGPSSATMFSGGATSNDHLVPLTPAGGSMVECACPLPPHDGMWTLWSFIGPALRRQDFEVEALAWAAFNAIPPAQPCMLRDPSSAEVASRAWVSSYFKLVPNRPGSLSLPRQGSPLPRAPSRPRSTYPTAAWPS